MSRRPVAEGTAPPLDEEDRQILRLLQVDSTRPLDRVAAKVGLSKTTVWNRIQRMYASGVILRQAVIVDPQKIGLAETFFVTIRTNRHNDEWWKQFLAVIYEFPEIIEAHRMAGHIDYLLKVQVQSTGAFDQFYKRLVAKIDLHDVTSNLSMEIMKHETALPI
jgi:Lrp/AsnC family transcriptional regulator